MKKKAERLDPEFYELTQGFILEGEWVSMDQPRACSYYNKNGENVTLGEKVSPQKSCDGTSFRSIPVEMRGITLRQLRAIFANASRRCVEEKWVDLSSNKRVTPKNMNLYHINDYVIKPFSESCKESFVEILPSTNGTQPSRFFISHSWSDSFGNILACIEQMVIDFRKNCDDEDDAKGGGMTEDTPLWFCAFALNQWAMNEAIATNPMLSPFLKAMEVTCFRTLSILDTEGHIYTRIWWQYESYMTLTAGNTDDSNDGLLVFYAAHKHSHDDLTGIEDRTAVGIIPGGAPGEEAYWTAKREIHFPPNLILRSREIRIESAIASEENDRIHILNSMVGKYDDLDSIPPTVHNKFDEVNDAIKTEFAATMPALNAASIKGKSEWKDILMNLSKGDKTGIFQLNFNAFEPRLSSSQARELFSYLPTSYTGLSICGADGEDGSCAFEGMIDWIQKVETLKYLSCFRCKVDSVDNDVGRAVGAQLIATLSTTHCETFEYLCISLTDLIDSENVLDWASALEEMTNLKELHLYGLHVSDLEKRVIRTAAHAPYIEGI